MAKARRRKSEHHLVTQYMEKISSKALEDFKHIVKEYAGQRHGIYALYKKDKLYYVGLATSLRGRLNQHLKDRHKNKWDSFSIYLTLDNKYIRELETLVLHIVSPKGNTQRGRFKKAENLKRRFKKDILDDMRSHADFVVGKAPKRKRKAKRVNGDGPVMWQYGLTSLKLRAFYKGEIHRAYVLKNGEIRYKNKRYNSPSLAGKAVIGRSVNGWTFWHYLRGPGDWVEIDNLRR